MSYNNDKLMNQLQNAQKQLADSQAKIMAQEDKIRALTQHIEHGMEEEMNIQK